MAGCTSLRLRASPAHQFATFVYACPSAFIGHLLDTDGDD